ncbi:hypothetical protein SH611_05070 [Geminicoccaceae bacterium 1502E]|nr:hypothetical protein [Geminicoccaceae bacterium 1502E]
MTVSPTIIDMTTSGRGATSAIRVHNSGTKPLPVEIVTSRLELDEQGGKTLTPAGDDLLVFPPQALVAPGGGQVFRIQWLGDALEASRTYRFSVNQLPVELDPGKISLQIVYNFGVLVTVSPPDAVPALEIVEARATRTEEGKPAVDLLLENSGSGAAWLSRAAVEIATRGNGARSLTLDPAHIAGSIGMGLVQPGKRRRFTVPADLPATAGALDVQLDYPR